MKESINVFFRCLPLIQTPNIISFRPLIALQHFANRLWLTPYSLWRYKGADLKGHFIPPNPNQELAGSQVS